MTSSAFPACRQFNTLKTLRVHGIGLPYVLTSLIHSCQAECIQLCSYSLELHASLMHCSFLCVHCKTHRASMSVRRTARGVQAKRRDWISLTAASVDRNSVADRSSSAVRVSRGEPATESSRTGQGNSDGNTTSTTRRDARESEVPTAASRCTGGASRAPGPDTVSVCTLQSHAQTGTGLLARAMRVARRCTRMSPIRLSTSAREGTCATCDH